MSAPSTQMDLEELTSLSVGSHASPGVRPGSKEARKMTATSGRTSLELLHKKDPLGAFSKTFMVTSQWVSTKCSLTWKAKATPRGRLLFQLAVSTLPTKETDSGLWATPNTMDHLPQRSEEATRKMQEGHRKGRSKPSNLREQVDEKTMSLWPTPTAMTGGTGVAPSHKDGSHGWNIGAAVNDSLSKNPIRMWPTPLSSDYKNMDTANQMSLSTSVRMWPTPVARDHKGGYQGGRIRNGKVSWDSLDVAVQHTDNQEKTGGQLNPMFVEWLMGYPKGWTDLNV